MDEPFEPLTGWRERPVEEILERAREFHAEMAERRTVREFAPRPVPREIIEHCIRTAGTAPSGAHMQPWYFVAVSDSELKRRIRLAAEREEREFYEHRASSEWLEALAPLGTDEHKPFLEDAPWLVAVFARRFGLAPGGRKTKHYYVAESVGIATGLLVAAVHHAGLVSLTHTPSPMRFLNELLGRPDNEAPFLLLVVGYPQAEARVPRLSRAPLEAIASFH